MAESFILVVAPMREELDALLEGVQAIDCALQDMAVGRLQAIGAPSLGVLFAVGGYGKVQLGVQTQYLIDHAEGIHTVLCTGTAGALAANLAPGDIVVGTRTIEHDYKERFVPEPLPSWPADPSVLDSLRHFVVEERFGFNLHFGPIASGDEDVIDPARSVEIARDTGSMCVAWEGAGAARAAAFNHLRFLEIRGITDSADARAAVNFRANLKRVMAEMGKLLIQWRRWERCQEPKMTASSRQTERTKDVKGGYHN